MADERGQADVAAATDIISDAAPTTVDAGQLSETLPRPAPAPDLAQEADEAPAKPGLVARTAAYVRTHLIAVVLVALIACVAVALLAVAGIRQSQLPSDDVVVADVRARVEAPAYSGGTYGIDDRLILSDVEVGPKHLSTDAPEGTVLEDSFGATGYAVVDVTCTFRNESVTATKTLTLGYAKQDGEWIGVGNEQDARVAYEATGGVEQDKVVDAMAQLLRKADQDGTTPNLAQIYLSGSFHVVSQEFDPETQTDTVTIRCETGGTFWSYGCDVTATFAFRPANGMWELTEATTSSGAKTRGYSPIVGTWIGSFRSQSTSVPNCYGAKGAPFELVITRAWSTDSGSKIEGTLTGLAHFHAPEEEAVEQSEGDTTFEDVAFTGRLVEDASGFEGSELTFVCELPDGVGGSMSLVVAFGTSDDPTEVIAQVTSVHTYEETILLLIPYDETVTYTDTYVLQKTS